GVVGAGAGERGGAGIRFAGDHSRAPGRAVGAAVAGCAALVLRRCQLGGVSAGGTAAAGCRRTPVAAGNDRPGGAPGLAAGRAAPFPARLKHSGGDGAFPTRAYAGVDSWHSTMHDGTFS